MNKAERFHLTLTCLWLLMVPIALLTGWIESLVFISACSIYANAAAHWGSFQAARAERAGEGSS